MERKYIFSCFFVGIESGDTDKFYLFSLYKHCRFGLEVCVPEIISTIRSICLTQGMGSQHDAENSLERDVTPLGLHLSDKSSSLTRRLNFPAIHC